MGLSIIKDIEIRACRGSDEPESRDAVAAVKLPGGSFAGHIKKQPIFTTFNTYTTL